MSCLLLRGEEGEEKLGPEDSGSRHAQRGWTARVAGSVPWKSRGPVLPPYFLLPLLDFLSTVAHCPPPESLSPLPVPLSPQPVGGRPSSSRPHWALQAAERHANRTRGQQKPLSRLTALEQCPESVGPHPQPSVGARGAARAVPAVIAAAGAPAGRGARGGEGSVAGAGRLGRGRRVAPRAELRGERRGWRRRPGLRSWEACRWRGKGAVRRIHRAEIKSWGRAGVPGGDLFLGETDARSSEGRSAFNESITYDPGGPTDLQRRPRPLPTPPRRGVCRPGHVRGAGGAERRARP